jgi:hypothetical protein
LPFYYGSVAFVTKLLSNFDYKKKSKFTRREYGMDEKGSSLAFWNKTQRYSIYDKIQEIHNTGYTKKEKESSQNFKNSKIPNQIIRFEFSLKNKQSVDAFLRKRIQSKNKDFTLKDVLQEKIHKEIMLEVFNDVYSDLSVGLISLGQMYDNEFLALLFQSSLKGSKIEKLYFWANIATKYGINYAYAQIKTMYEGGHQSDIKKELKQLLDKINIPSGNLPNLIQFLLENHKKNEKIRPKNLRF